MTDIKTGPDFAFPMEDAPKDGSILRLLVKFDRKSAAGAFEDTPEPSWTIGTNNKANTGEDQWDIVGWSWEQDVFCHAYGAKAIGWLPFHTESNEPTALPAPSPAPSASMGRVTDDALRAGVDAGMATGKRLREIGHQFSEDYMAMAISQDAVKAALDSPPAHGGGEGLELLATMATHFGWELDWGPHDPNDEEGEYGWRVHDRRGNRSDLEWTLIGFGASPADALRAATRSQP